MKLELILSVLTGLITAIPLVIKLVEYVHRAVRERNWERVLHLVIALMTEAEAKFETGAEKKEWVLELVQAGADAIDYEIDPVRISELIDGLCALTKRVNVQAAEPKS